MSEGDILGRAFAAAERELHAHDTWVGRNGPMEAMLDFEELRALLARAQEADTLEEERDRMRDGLREVCSEINGFQVKSLMDLLVVARAALVGESPEVIRAEHTIQLSPEESQRLRDMLNRPTLRAVDYYRQRAGEYRKRPKLRMDDTSADADLFRDPPNG